MVARSPGSNVERVVDRNEPSTGEATTEPSRACVCTEEASEEEEGMALICVNPVDCGGGDSKWGWTDTHAEKALVSRFIAAS
jgi:hypothetical protein